MTSDARFQPYVLAARQSDSPTPLYHQLYSILKSMIVEDVLSYGERVPTESELADLFSVSRITSKRALTNLLLRALSSVVGVAAPMLLTSTPRVPCKHR